MAQYSVDTAQKIVQSLQGFKHEYIRTIQKVLNTLEEQHNLPRKQVLTLRRQLMAGGAEPDIQHPASQQAQEKIEQHIRQFRQSVEARLQEQLEDHPERENITTRVLEQLRQDPMTPPHEMLEKLGGTELRDRWVAQTPWVEKRQEGADTRFSYGQKNRTR